jgi:glycosyltransferase involved in cell wall biosynthesis
MGSLVYALVAWWLFRATLVVDCHNVESQLSSDLGSPGHYVFARTVERLALRLADLVLVTSERDRALFPDAIQEKSLVVANGFDQSTFYADGRDPEDRILFFGNMNYEPNREAVEVIADHIAPHLAESDVDADIHVAGPHCDQIRPAVAHSDTVTVVGLVDDLAEYIRNSAVVIVPLRTGSGTRLKIIESLACGTPVVSTPKGAEGWPDSWPSLVVTELDTFPERLLETVRERPSPSDAELSEFQRYTWESQVGRIRPYLVGDERKPSQATQRDCGGSSE